MKLAPRMRMALAAACLAALAPYPVFAQKADAAGKTRDRMGAAGCTLCHADAPRPREAGAAPPPAPSFSEIAQRYRGVPGAEDRLTKVVLAGADAGERHWKDRLDFNAMGANAPRVSPAEARAYVRWILARP